jgi:hypothetical protein
MGCERASLSPATEGRAVDEFLAFVESSELSEWIRGSESLFAFPAIITLHTIAMGFLAGGSTAIDLRILGFAPHMPLKPLRRFLPVLWLALAVNAVTGTLLLIAYPTKALTNPVFYVKLCLIALAVWLVYRIGVVALRAPNVDQKPLAANAKLLAAASIAAWVALITAGRLLAYTHKWELLGIRSIT